MKIIGQVIPLDQSLHQWITRLLTLRTEYIITPKKKKTLLYIKESQELSNSSKLTLDSKPNIHHSVSNPSPFLLTHRYEAFFTNLRFSEVSL